VRGQASSGAIEGGPRPGFAAGVQYRENGLAANNIDLFAFAVGSVSESYRFALQASAPRIADGKVAIAGDPVKSDIMFLITLPADDPDIMPAKGDPLTKEQVAAIETWIKEGAKWPDGVKLDVPEKAGPKPDPLNTPGLPVSDAEKKAVATAQEKGALAMRLAQNTNWLRVDFSLHGKDVKDADAAVVKDMPNLVDLDLGGTQVTDAALAHVAGLKNLYRLHLERTKVTGEGLKHLAGLPKLEYVNLYGTEVDDKAIEHLSKVKSLKKVYLWQTKVTKEAADKLAKAVPGLYVNIGWEHEKPAKAEPVEEPKPDPNAPKFSISDIMKEAMKGGLAKKVADGKGNKDEVKLLLEYVTALGKHEPPKGDAKSWKEKTDALIAAVTLVDKADEKGKAMLAKAINCKACHSAHKP